MEQPNQFNQHLQDNIINLMIVDTDFLKQAMPVIKIEYFTAYVSMNIYNICFEYFDVYGEAPKEYFWNSLEEFFERRSTSEEDKKLYDMYLEKIFFNIGDVNKQWAVNQLDTFVRRAEVRLLMAGVRDLAEHNKLDEMDKLIKDYPDKMLERESKDIQPLSARRQETIEFMELISENKRIGLPSGYNCIDEKAGGLKYIVILGAPYGYGKSTFCLNIAKNLALNEGIPTLYFDRENDKNINSMKLLCMSHKIPWSGGMIHYELTHSKIRDKGVDWNSYTKWNKALEHIYFPEITGFDADTIERYIDQIREITKKEEILVVYDSLQKLPSLGGKIDRRTLIDSALDDTRNLQQKTGATFLLISNYPKGVESGHGISLFKESGEIGGTARQALALDNKVETEWTDEGVKRKQYLINLYVIKDNLSVATDHSSPVGNFYLKDPYWIYEENIGYVSPRSASDADVASELKKIRGGRRSAK